MPLNKPTGSNAPSNLPLSDANRTNARLALNLPPVSSRDTSQNGAERTEPYYENIQGSDEIINRSQTRFSAMNKQHHNILDTAEENIEINEFLKGSSEHAFCDKKGFVNEDNYSGVYINQASSSMENPSSSSIKDVTDHNEGHYQPLIGSNNPYEYPTYVFPVDEGNRKTQVYAELNKSLSEDSEYCKPDKVFAPVS